MRADFLVLSVVVGCAPTKQSDQEEKELFYQRLDAAMQMTGSLVVVIGRFIARVGEKLSQATGSFGLAKSTSVNGRDC